VATFAKRAPLVLLVSILLPPLPRLSAVVGAFLAVLIDLFLIVETRVLTAIVIGEFPFVPSHFFVVIKIVISFFKRLD